MTREEIFRDYKVVNGAIRSPGKFEGERVYVPYFWELFLDGFAEEDDGDILTFTITQEDLDEFPELVEDKYAVGDELYLRERDDGFVIQCARSPREEPSPEAWAVAIAARIADEWEGKEEDPETAILLAEVLSKALAAVPEETMKLVGTSLIEEDYFTE